ncbi:MAG: Hpt domain-containing protein [Rhodobacteraceae bacterium]|nr:Hpt domain-containing protein [Paracoccaceae bacterium]
MIQWTRVNELRDEIGAEDFDEVVDLFLEEVEEAIQDLSPDSTANQMEQHLHFLKGSALNLGFQTFSDLCQNGERKSARGETGSIDLAAIIDGFERSKAMFIAKLPEMLAA